MALHVETDKSAMMDYSLVYPPCTGVSTSGIMAPSARPKTIYCNPEFIIEGQEDLIHPELS